MAVLRWVLLVWSAGALLIFLAQPLLLPMLLTPGRLALLALSVVFYVLNIVFLWRSRPHR